ncbi:unnamed protein product [Calypogeia fissa]
MASFVDNPPLQCTSPNLQLPPIQTRTGSSCVSSPRYVSPAFRQNFTTPPHQNSGYLSSHSASSARVGTSKRALEPRDTGLHVKHTEVDTTSSPIAFSPPWKVQHIAEDCGVTTALELGTKRLDHTSGTRNHDFAMHSGAFMNHAHHPMGPAAIVLVEQQSIGHQVQDSPTTSEPTAPMWTLRLRIHCFGLCV